MRERNHQSCSYSQNGVRSSKNHGEVVALSQWDLNAVEKVTHFLDHGRFGGEFI